MPKKISIITINRNNATGLKQTIESVVAQLNETCEYILVDGQSTDESLQIIEEHQHQLAYWISEPDRGIYHAMNKGILRARGDYCLFLNSGDWLHTDSLAIATNECSWEDIIYFNMYLSYPNARFEKLSYPKHLTMRDFFQKTLGHQSALIRTELFAKYGFYNETLTIHSDYEFWIKSIIIGNVTCKYVDSILSYYDMTGRSSMPTMQTRQEIDGILNRHLPRRVLDDYEYWFAREREMEILVWFKNRKLLYRGLVLLYKIAKNLTRLVAK